MFKNILYNLATDKYQGFFAGCAKIFLFLLSLLYGLVVKILSGYHLARRKKVVGRLISIGNITLGGTGKTSLVEYLARILSEKGKKVVILSRGYKRKVTKSQSHKVTGVEEMGDEPYLLSRKLSSVPVLVGSDRVKLAAQASSRYGADTLILDDGFQQWRIKKDLEIVTIDATRPFGNRRLLPRGILREPLSALRRADVLVLTKVNLSRDLLAARKVLTGINPAALLVESMHYPLGFYEMGQPEQLIPPEMVAVRGSLSLCGIGDPDSFELLLHSLGVRPQFCLRFPDHHDYSPEDLKEVVRKSRQEDIGIVITTEKDAVRLANIVPGGFPLKILVLKIELRIVKNEQEFLDRLFKLCAD